MYFRGIILHFESGRSKKFYQMTFFAFTFTYSDMKGDILCINSESTTKNAERVRPFLG